MFSGRERLEGMCPLRPLFLSEKHWQVAGMKRFHAVKRALHVGFISDSIILTGKVQPFPEKSKYFQLEVPGAAAQKKARACSKRKDPGFTTSLDRGISTLYHICTRNSSGFWLAERGPTRYH